jgi:hypothetical protein
MPKFDTTVALTQVDGNAFAIMGAVKSAIKALVLVKKKLTSILLNLCQVTTTI